MLRKLPDAKLTDAILRLMGGIFFAHCDTGDRDHAAKAIESLRRFGDINSDNPYCFALCHSLADAQEDALCARDYDFRKSLKIAD